jgi:hypothetical protein
MLAAPEDGRAVAAIVKLIGKEIPLCVIPGIEEAELEYDERRRRGVRRATRPDDHRHAHTRDGGARSAAAEVRPPRRDRRPRVTDAPLPNAAGSNVTSFPSTAEVYRAGRQEREGPSPKVVGFGDHLPAFLSRRPRIIARP